MASLALLNEGVRDHFPICGIFVGNFFGNFRGGGTRPFPTLGTRIWYFCEGSRMPSHALVIDMALAIGAEIPAPSEVIDVWMGISAPPQGRRRI